MQVAAPGARREGTGGNSAEAERAGGAEELTAVEIEVFGGNLRRTDVVGSFDDHGVVLSEAKDLLVAMTEVLPNLRLHTPNRLPRWQRHRERGLPPPGPASRRLAGSNPPHGGRP